MATKGIVKKKNKFVPSKDYSFRCSEDQIRLFKRVFDLYDDDNDGNLLTHSPNHLLTHLLTQVKWILNS